MDVHRVSNLSIFISICLNQEMILAQVITCHTQYFVILEVSHRPSKRGFSPRVKPGNRLLHANILSPGIMSRHPGYVWMTNFRLAKFYNPCYDSSNFRCNKNILKSNQAISLYSIRCYWMTLAFSFKYVALIN